MVTGGSIGLEDNTGKRMKLPNIVPVDYVWHEGNTVVASTNRDPFLPEVQKALFQKMTFSSAYGTYILKSEKDRYLGRIIGLADLLIVPFVNNFVRTNVYTYEDADEETDTILINEMSFIGSQRGSFRIFAGNLYLTNLEEFIGGYHSHSKNKFIGEAYKGFHMGVEIEVEYRRNKVDEALSTLRHLKKHKEYSS